MQSHGRNRTIHHGRRAETDPRVAHDHVPQVTHRDANGGRSGGCDGAAGVGFGGPVSRSDSSASDQSDAGSGGGGGEPPLDSGRAAGRATGRATGRARGRPVARASGRPLDAAYSCQNSSSSESNSESSSESPPGARPPAESPRAAAESAASGGAWGRAWGRVWGRVWGRAWGRPLVAAGLSDTPISSESESESESGTPISARSAAVRLTAVVAASVASGRRRGTPSDVPVGTAGPSGGATVGTRTPQGRADICCRRTGNGGGPSSLSLEVPSAKKNKLGRAGRGTDRHVRDTQDRRRDQARPTHLVRRRRRQYCAGRSRPRRRLRPTRSNIRHVAGVRHACDVPRCWESCCDTRTLHCLGCRRDQETWVLLGRPGTGVWRLKPRHQLSNWPFVLGDLWGPVAKRYPRRYKVVGHLISSKNLIF